MNGQGIKWLQWGYPMLLWLLVACFTLLACKNVVASNASWIVQSGSPSMEKEPRVFLATLR